VSGDLILKNITKSNVCYECPYSYDMYANDNSESHITSGKLQLHPIHICKNSSKEKNRRYHYILSQDLHVISPVSIFVIIYIARK